MSAKSSDNELSPAGPPPSPVVKLPPAEEYLARALVEGDWSKSPESERPEGQASERDPGTQGAVATSGPAYLFIYPRGPIVHALRYRALVANYRQIRPKQRPDARVSKEAKDRGCDLILAWFECFATGRLCLYMTAGFRARGRWPRPDMFELVKGLRTEGGEKGYTVEVEYISKRLATVWLRPAGGGRLSVWQFLAPIGPAGSRPPVRPLLCSGGAASAPRNGPAGPRPGPPPAAPLRSTPTGSRKRKRASSE